METFLTCVKDSEEVMIRWNTGDCKKSKVLITDSMMSRIKDGRFVVESTTNNEK